MWKWILKKIEASITWISKSFFNNIYVLIIEDTNLFKNLMLKRFLHISDLTGKFHVSGLGCSLGIREFCYGSVAYDYRHGASFKITFGIKGHTFHLLLEFYMKTLQALKNKALTCSVNCISCNMLQGQQDRFL